MTERELRRLVHLWAGRLGLGHFEFRVAVEAFDPVTHVAEVNCSPDYDQARIRFQRWAVDGSAPPEECEFGAWDDLEVLAVHELLHVAVRPMRRFWRSLEDGNYLHRDVFELANDQRAQGEEEAVDRLARSLVAAWRG